MADRKILQSFMNALMVDSFGNPGILNPILKRVQADNTLDLEIREGYINIYYRGGNILWIKELTKGQGFEFKFNPNYGKGYSNLLPANLFAFNGKSQICTPNVDAWLSALPYLKDIMDMWFGNHPKEEREFQQHVVRDNNYSGVANATDYFILDIEYDNRNGDSSKKGARFDLLAFQWNSDGVSRKLTSKTNPRLCCIEMKYGDGALNGKAGLDVHFDDFCDFANGANNLQNLKAEALDIFEQKRKLGLITGLVKNNNSLKHLDDTVDFIILAANHDPEKTNFLAGLNYIQQNLTKCPFGVNVKVCESSNMGYGLFKEKVWPIGDFIARHSLKGSSPITVNP